MDAGARFADIPRAVERLLTDEHAPLPPLADLPGLPDAAQRVLVLLLDAFGLRFVQRHAEHPLLRRLARDGTVTPVASQFPSTTTAHVTTMHTGLPVGLHGLYEWHLLEPAFGEIVTPLRATVGDRSLLDAGLDPAVLVPSGPGLYDRLTAAGVAVTVHQPDRFSPSVFDRAVAPHTTFAPFGELHDGLRAAITSLAAADRAYAYVYFDLIDTQGHLTGPASQDFDARVIHTLDAVQDALFGPGAPPVPDDTWLLLTADHGQLDVDPARVLWLDDLHPPLRDLALGPAGSARDVFLHVEPDAVDTTVVALRARLEDAAEVMPVADLLAAQAFGPEVGPRLLDRLATVAVLPAPGRLAWLRTHADRQSSFHGHHGGRTPEETGTHLSVLRLG